MVSQNVMSKILKNENWRPTQIVRTASARRQSDSCLLGTVNMNIIIVDLHIINTPSPSHQVLTACITLKTRTAMEMARMRGGSLMVAATCADEWSTKPRTALTRLTSPAERAERKGWGKGEAGRDGAAGTEQGNISSLGWPARCGNHPRELI